MKTSQLEVFADYSQFHLCDLDEPGDLSEAWSEEASAKMLAIAPRIVGVGTARNSTVPVTVEVLDTVPVDDSSQWDMVNECSLDIPSGKLVVMGCTASLKDSPRFDLAPGTYDVRISYGNLAQVRSPLDGDDHYRVQIWPTTISEQVAPIAVTSPSAYLRLLREAIAELKAASLGSATAALESSVNSSYMSSSELLGETGIAIARCLAQCGERAPKEAVSKLEVCLSEVRKVWPNIALQPTDAPSARRG